jgi:hypothetical protein
MSQISPPTPYTNAAPWRLWRRAVANPPGGEVDPVVDFPLRITRTDRIVTAGSCFAQNIARHVRLRGFTYLVTEPGHAVLDDETLAAFQYGIYSARYGNIYSARQLLQLFRRAHGEFMPEEPAWRQDGAWFDPFRPLIQPDGFASLAECEADRAQHLAAVRRAFADLDVFIFTLGLTEIWESAADGAVFPLCPGAPRGVFDPARYRLRNLTVAENVADLTAFLGLLRAVNPGARVILTVSPVPLVATAEAAHVLTATTLSKSVLRVAADTVCRTGAAAYFPAYEIVTGVQARGAYFADDCRSVTEAGVAHVMRVFFRHAAEEGEAVAAPKAVRPVFEAGGAYVQVVCEEESLDEG